MKQIINFKSRLQTINSIFDRQYKLKCFVPKIIFPTDTDFSISDFEAECLLLDKTNNSYKLVLSEVLELSKQTIAVYGKLLNLICGIDGTGETWKDNKIEIETNAGFETYIAFYAKEDNKCFELDYLRQKWNEVSKDFDVNKGVLVDNLYLYDFVFQINTILAKQIDNFEMIQQPESDFDTNDKTNPLIFDVEVLQSFSKFDGLIWEKLDVDWFRLNNPKRIILKKECTQRMFIYFFDKYLNKEHCKNPTEWLRLIFTKHFSYTNQHKEIKVLQEPINKKDKKSIAFNEFKQKFDTLFMQND